MVSELVDYVLLSLGLRVRSTLQLTKLFCKPRVKYNLCKLFSTSNFDIPDKNSIMRKQNVEG